MDETTTSATGGAAAAGPGADPGLAGRALELLQAGGPVVAILLGLSIVALAILLAKLMQFRAAGLFRRARTEAVFDQLDRGRVREALHLAATARDPVSRLLARALRGRLAHFTDDDVRAELHRAGQAELEALRGWMRPLEVIASLAPLMGLFGTVLGMIGAFRELEAAGNQVNPAILSGGIWEALLTTAVGLAVGIPVVVVVNWLERRVERLAHAMDDAVARLFAPDLSERGAAASGAAPQASHGSARIAAVAAAPGE